MIFSDAQRLLDDAVTGGVFPGGTILVADQGQVVWEHVFGRLVPGESAVTPKTYYDVASLTKVAATTASLMQLVAEDAINIDDAVVTHVPELACEGMHEVRVRHLLSHSSGLPAWHPFYEELLKAPPSVNRRKKMLQLVAQHPLQVRPGTRSVYSDLGFILLGFFLERVTGERLDSLAGRLVFEPLGMQRTRFVDLAAGGARPDPVAPTEICPYRGLVRGEVHDDNCHAAGGILGHAGLFSTAQDLGLLCRALVTAWQGSAGPFSADVVRMFFAASGVPGSTWRLGWDGPAPAPGLSQAGERWSKSGVGHMGFTGCSVWVDPSRARWVVLLSNRVHPSRDDDRIKKVRPRVHDAISNALG